MQRRLLGHQGFWGFGENGHFFSWSWGALVIILEYLGSKLIVLEILGALPKSKLEDLKVLKRSPDLLNNVKIGQGQLRLIIQTYFVLPYMGSGHFDQVT